MGKTSKEVRQVLRVRWGKNWWAVHPVMKKARLEWGRQLFEKGQLSSSHVRVTEADGSTYVC